LSSGVGENRAVASWDGLRNRLASVKGSSGSSDACPILTAAVIRRLLTVCAVDRSGPGYCAGMTTLRDHGSNSVSMLECDLRPSNLYPTLVLALRDMRHANGRADVTGVGGGNESWIGLAVGMTVLDALSGDQESVGTRFEGLLKSHGITPEDATIIYMLRCSLLHGYGLPKPTSTFDREVLLTPFHDVYALDTSTDGKALVSVPVFCSRLVERIVSEGYASWDVSLIDTNRSYF
jgi:hypothetical protein